MEGYYVGGVLERGLSSDEIVEKEMTDGKEGETVAFVCRGEP